MPFVLIALALAFLVMLLFGGTPLDRALLTLAGFARQPDLLPYVRGLTELGGAWVLVPAGVAGTIALLVRRAWADAVLLVAITIGGRLLVEGLKIWTGRPRPDIADPQVVTYNLAFPSAHAANSTIVWLSLAFLLTRTRRPRTLAVWAAAWTALAVGFSRVVLGVHWPTDVIGGWALGLCWTLLLLRLAGHEIGDGTPRAAAPLVGGRRALMDRNDRSTDRAETARQTDDSDLIEGMEDAPSHGNRSGHRLGHDIGTQDELAQTVGEGGVTRVRGEDKKEDPNLPRFNQS